MSGVTPEALQQTLLARGASLVGHIKEQTEDEFQKRMTETGSNIVIRSKLSSLGYDLQTSLSALCQLLAFLSMKIIDVSDVLVFATLLLSLGSMPLKIAAQFFRKQGNITLTKGTKSISCMQEMCLDRRIQGCSGWWGKKSRAPRDT